MNAWLSQASYHCGNFSDIYHSKFYKLKRPIDHAFPVCIHTENQNQVSFYHFALHDIYVILGMRLSHLCYCLINVIPQKNFPHGVLSHIYDKTKQYYLQNQAPAKTTE